eukprot:GHVT01039273.1.p1 GENE.GHVT01039273.1~~GHVT01039273.1.p1  ORF type:complete len:114 (-),score=1.54 GHVT01039273.1:314-655(-)
MKQVDRIIKFLFLHTTCLLRPCYDQRTKLLLLPVLSLLATSSTTTNTSLFFQLLVLVVSPYWQLPFGLIVVRLKAVSCLSLPPSHGPAIPMAEAYQALLRVATICLVDGRYNC